MWCVDKLQKPQSAAERTQVENGKVTDEPSEKPAKHSGHLAITSVFAPKQQTHIRVSRWYFFSKVQHNFFSHKITWTKRNQTACFVLVQASLQHAHYLEVTYYSQDQSVIWCVYINYKTKDLQLQGSAVRHQVYLVILQIATFDHVFFLD